MEGMKVCKRCSGVKPMEEFHAVKLCRDGRRPVCKACVAKEKAEKFAEDPAASRAAARARVAKYRLTHVPSVEERARKQVQVRAWDRKNPGKKRAHWAVRDALRRGSLEKSACEVCGAGKVHAHHDDYAKPLDVRWLCPAHHAELQRIA